MKPILQLLALAASSSAIFSCKKPLTETPPLQLRDGQYLSEPLVHTMLPEMFTTAGRVGDTAVIRAFLDRIHNNFASIPPADTLFYFGAGSRPASDPLQISITGTTAAGTILASYVSGSVGTAAGNISFDGNAQRQDADYYSVRWSESRELPATNSAAAALLHSLPKFPNSEQCGNWPDTYQGANNYCKFPARFTFTNMGDSLSVDLYRAFVQTHRAIQGAPGQYIFTYGFTRTLADYVTETPQQLLRERDTLILQRSWRNLRRQ